DPHPRDPRHPATRSAGPPVGLVAGLVRRAVRRRPRADPRRAGVPADAPRVEARGRHPRPAGGRRRGRPARPARAGPRRPGPPPAPGTPGPPPPAPPARRSVWSRVWSGGQFVVALGLTLAALAYLLTHPGSKPEVATDGRQAAADEAVRLAGPGLIRVAPDTPLGRKLSEGASAVRPTRITAPVLTVTGTVVASLRPGPANSAAVTPAVLSVIGGAAAVRASDYWQFNAPEVLTTYTDWQKAK